MADAYPCGHPKSAENIKTYHDGDEFRGRCRRCWNTKEARRKAGADRHLEYRVRILPKQLESTRAKLARLEAEAVALGFHDLVERRA